MGVHFERRGANQVTPQDQLRRMEQGPMEPEKGSILSISVVIPTHQRAHLIGRALRSVLPQLESNDEVIVVDDGSTDDTETRVSEISDARVRYIRQKQSGAGAARNRGIAEAKKDLVAFLDSDDEWLDGKVWIERQLFARHADVLFSFSDFTRIFAGEVHRRSIGTWHTDPRTWREITGSEPQPYSSIATLPPGQADFEFYLGDIYRGEMHTNYILTSSLVVRRKEAGACLHFGESLTTFEDWECFGRLARAGKAVFLNRESAIQHGHGGPRLTDAGLLDSARSRMTVLERVWGSDKEFLAKYGGEYRVLYREQQIMAVRGLLVEGRSCEARKSLAAIEHPPFGYRALSLVPGSLVSGCLNFRRTTMARLRRLFATPSHRSMTVAEL